MILAFQRASFFSEACFVSVCLAVVIMTVSAVAFSDRSPSKGAKRASWFLVGLAAYLALFAGLVRSGWMERAVVPNVPLVLAGTVGLGACMGFTAIGRKLATGLPLWSLVLFQGFRFPLELILHDWANRKTIPETMTWTGSNWDIVAGLSALLIAPFVTKLRWLAWLFNLLGIVLLINVARVAVFSSAVPFGWGVEPPLELILHFPYAFIVPVCVGGAAFGHVVLTRKLLS